MNESPKFSLNVADLKEVALVVAIFVAPYVIANISTIQTIVEKYVSNPDISALIISILIFSAKKFISGQPNSTVVDSGSTSVNSVESNSTKND